MGTYGSKGRKHEDQQEEAEVPRTKSVCEHEYQRSHNDWHNGIPK